MPNDKTTVYELDLMIDGIEEVGVYIRSKDVPGLHLVGKSLQVMKPIVEKAIKRLFKDNRGFDVNVVWVDNVAKLSGPHRTLPPRLAVYKKAA